MNSFPDPHSHSPLTAETCVERLHPIRLTLWHRLQQWVRQEVIGPDTYDPEASFYEKNAPEIFHLMSQAANKHPWAVKVDDQQQLS
ncbi:MAG TPA: hypothetical protein V6D03_13010 [Candidatus Caenarcaniphilales bacterium]